MKVVHLGTVIQTQFGLLDDDGNIVQSWTVAPGQDRPDALAISKLEDGAFVAAFNALVGAKGELQKKVDEELAKNTTPDVKMAEVE